MKTPTLRLHFLDGLRGLCALYVLIHHEVLINDEVAGALSPFFQALHELFDFGHVSVVFFIVLSGFSLTLPIARSGEFQLVGSLRDFVKRRARRILPPYYAALAFSLATILAYGKLTGKMTERALDGDVLVSHLLLIHNWNFDWAFRINAPMWSIPTEWQIYFLFPLLLLPCARRFGLLATIALGFALGSLPTLLSKAGYDWSWACPWFLGSFALGMAGAVLAFSPAFARSFWRERAPWGLLSLLSFALVAVILTSELARTLPYAVVDAVTSLFAFCLVNACVASARKGDEASWFVRVLGSPWLVGLGGYSYSLYLLQHPFLRLTGKLFTRLGLARDAHLAAQILLLTPLLCALAWLFACFFERPFLSRRRPEPTPSLLMSVGARSRSL